MQYLSEGLPHWGLVLVRRLAPALLAVEQLLRDIKQDLLVKQVLHVLLEGILIDPVLVQVWIEKA
jgi:hypothetical protein